MLHKKTSVLSYITAPFHLSISETRGTHLCVKTQRHTPARNSVSLGLSQYFVNLFNHRTVFSFSYEEFPIKECLKDAALVSFPPSRDCKSFSLGFTLSLSIIINAKYQNFFFFWVLVLLHGESRLPGFEV